MTARVGRIYDPASTTDGVRILVDRLWPRGLTRAKAGLDEWCKQIAPSPELRRWYSHDPRRFTEFRHRYRRELDGPEQAAALAHLKELASGRTLTLLTASKDVAISEATVLAELIDEEPHERGERHGQPRPSQPSKP
jgi:uncharacterized protein YeaO (DUF488 family)